MDIDNAVILLNSGDRDEILKCLYRLSGPYRGLKLPQSVMELLRNLILSTDEEISWRALFLMGVVWADSRSLPFIIQRLSRPDEDNLVFAAGLDAIFVIAQRYPQDILNNSIELVSGLAQRLRSPALAEISALLKRFLQGEIGEEEYRANKPSV